MIETTQNIEDIIRGNSVQFVMWTGLLVTLLTTISVLVKNKSEILKTILYILMVVSISLTTFYLASSTIYLNTISKSKGPVHHHADFEVWDCGKELDLVDPKGLSNKVGTTTFHEHNDKRIHIEGVIVEDRDINLSRFFEVVGGVLREDRMVIPTNNGLIERVDGEVCPNGEEGSVQTFVYSNDIENSTFSQQKIDNPESFVIDPYAQVPPGNCIIIEFGPKREKTDKMCEQYKVKELKGELRHGT